MTEFFQANVDLMAKLSRREMWKYLFFFFSVCGVNSESFFSFSFGCVCGGGGIFYKILFNILNECHLKIQKKGLPRYPFYTTSQICCHSTFLRKRKRQNYIILLHYYHYLPLRNITAFNPKQISSNSSNNVAKTQ